MLPRKPALVFAMALGQGTSLLGEGCSASPGSRDCPSTGSRNTHAPFPAPSLPLPRLILGAGCCTELQLGCCLPTPPGHRQEASLLCHSCSLYFSQRLFMVPASRGGWMVQPYPPTADRPPSSIPAEPQGRQGSYGWHGAVLQRLSDPRGSLLSFPQFFLQNSCSLWHEDPGAARLLRSLLGEQQRASEPSPCAAWQSVPAEVTWEGPGQPVGKATQWWAREASKEAQA